MPNIQKKSSERFLGLDEFRSLLSDASPREHEARDGSVLLSACPLSDERN